MDKKNSSILANEKTTSKVQSEVAPSKAKEPGIPSSESTAKKNYPQERNSGQDTSRDSKIISADSNNPVETYWNAVPDDPRLEEEARFVEVDEVQEFQEEPQVEEAELSVQSQTVLQLLKKRKPVVKEIKRMLSEIQDKSEFEMSKDLILKAFKAKHVTSELLSNLWKEVLHERSAADISLPWGKDPEPTKENIDIDELMEELIQTLESYTVFPKVSIPHAYAKVVALWVIATWGIEGFYHVPYLLITAPTHGCGKSVFLKVLAKLSRRSVPTSNCTPASIFHLIDEHQPTLLIDEVDTFLKKDADMQGLINDGNEKGGHVLRAEKLPNEKYTTRSYNVFGFKVLCGIKSRSISEALSSRCIVIPLKRKLDSEKTLFLGETPDSFWQSLQSKFAKISPSLAKWVKERHIEIPDELINRNADDWREIFATGDFLDSLCSTAPNRKNKKSYGEEARQIAILLIETDSTLSDSETLLHDIRNVFRLERFAACSFISSQNLVDALVENKDLMWENYKSRKLTSWLLAKLLKPFGIRPKPIKKLNNQRGYYKADFEDAFNRYLKKVEDDSPIKKETDGKSQKTLIVTNIKTNTNPIVEFPEELDPEYPDLIEEDLPFT